MTGIVEPCAPLRAFLAERRGEAEAARLAARFVEPDPDATYVRTIRIDVEDVPIHNVVIASCTGGSLADLRAAAAVLEGRRFHEGVRVTVTPSSQDVADAARREGLLDLFGRLGATVTDPGCGSCIGNGPGIPYEGETTASTTNRNFDRRMGAPGPVYLLPPAIAAASAVTGRHLDPRKRPARV